MVSFICVAIVPYIDYIVTVSYHGEYRKQQKLPGTVSSPSLS